MKKLIVLVAMVVFLATATVPALAKPGYSDLRRNFSGVRGVFVYEVKDGKQVFDMEKGCPGGSPALGGKWTVGNDGKAQLKVMCYNFPNIEAAEAAITPEVIARAKAIQRPAGATGENVAYTPFWDCTSQGTAPAIEEEALPVVAPAPAPALATPTPAPAPAPAISAVPETVWEARLAKAEETIEGLKAEQAKARARASRCAQLAELGYGDCSTAIPEFQGDLHRAGADIVVDGLWGPETAMWLEKALTAKREREGDVLMQGLMVELGFVEPASAPAVAEPVATTPVVAAPAPVVAPAAPTSATSGEVEELKKKVAAMEAAIATKDTAPAPAGLSNFACAGMALLGLLLILAIVLIVRRRPAPAPNP